MNWESLKRYLNKYEGLNKLFRIEFIKKIETNLTSELNKLGYDHSVTNKFYKQIEKYGEQLNKMKEEGLYKEGWKKFEVDKQAIENDLNHYRSLGKKEEIQEHYSKLGNQYLTIGDVDNAITQFRTAKNYICQSSSLDLIPSLKKVQLFRFEEEELLVVPHTSHEIYTNKSEFDNGGFERFHISCQLIAIKLLQFERALELAMYVNLEYPNHILEITCERDLAYYMVISLISLRNYNEIMRRYQKPEINNFIQKDQIAKDCINNLLRNEFKNAVISLKSIQDTLKFDSIVGLRVEEIRRVCLTSILCIYLESFRMIKLSSLAEDLDLENRDLTSLLESEIRRKNLNFLINRVDGYIERKEEEETYMDVFNRGTKMVNRANKWYLEKFLERTFETKDTNKNLIGGYMEEIDDDIDEGIKGSKNMINKLFDQGKNNVKGGMAMGGKGGGRPQKKR